MRLRTIGYEGIKPEEFWSRLLANQVKVLVDVRENPLSRKPGFSKTALAQQADIHGITYIHISSLGCPKEIRNDYRQDGDWSRYTIRFKAYLETQAQAIQELVGMVAEQECCLLCFEADPNYCHRSYVAEKVASHFRPTFVIQHITDPAPVMLAPNSHPLALADR
jgi:uncharacterized protein (DUF488 family)